MHKSKTLICIHKNNKLSVKPICLYIFFLTCTPNTHTLGPLIIQQYTPIHTFQTLCSLCIHPF